MKQQYHKAWAHISIFYAKLGWAGLIQNAIAPTVDKWDSADCTIQHFISFGNSQGENLIMMIHCMPSDCCKAHIKNSMSRIITYMQKHPSAPNVCQLNYEGKCLFMPFPNNTIQYNLSYTIPSDDFLVIELKCEITKHIYSTNPDAIDESFLLELVLSILMRFCIIYTKENNFTSREILEEYTKISQQTMPQDQIKDCFRSFETLLEDNRVYFDQIKKELILKFHSIPDTGSLENVFYSFCNKYPLINCDRWWFKKMNQAIYEQLDLDQSAVLGSYFILGKIL
jgi:hypothetical protein